MAAGGALGLIILKETDMNFSLRPRIVLMGFLPGFLFIILFVAILYDYKIDIIIKFAKEINFSIGFAVVIFAFTLGQVIDSIRDVCIEDQISIWKNANNDVNINWDFWFFINLSG